MPLFQLGETFGEIYPFDDAVDGDAMHLLRVVFSRIAAFASLCANITGVFMCFFSFSVIVI